MSIQGIPVDPRTLVYRRICDQLRTDPIIGARVHWIFWDGKDEDVLAFSQNRPTVEISPRLEGQQWYSPDAFKGVLALDVVLYVVNTKDATDVVDLWGAIERALYPKSMRDKQLTFEKALRDAGAQTGEPELNAPAAITPVIVGTQESPQFKAQFRAQGSIRITCVRSINP